MIINVDTDRFVKEVLEQAEYSFLFKDLTIIDLGCNVGTFSFWIYPQAKQIYAIDIAQRNIELLDETIKANKFTKISTFNVGIAGRNGKRPIEKGGDGTPGDGGLHLGTGDTGIDVYTLEAFMDSQNIKVVDVLKMDVEGTEFEIVNSEFPRDRINTVIGECHGGKNLQKEFEDLGYRYFDYGGHFMAKRI